jgi:hypothetical protein
MNQCDRKGPCLHGDPVPVSRGEYWDYYDRQSRSYIYLRCRLNQKHYVPSLLEIEEAEKYSSGLSTESYETPDLQLADTNGVWFTRSDDPENYRWPTETEEGKSCSICDLVCDIREMYEYMQDDGTCPYNDAAPELTYSKIRDHDNPCSDFLHPLLLQDIKAINQRRARTAKAKLWQYLKQKHWRDALINKGERILDVWQRNYQPVRFYFNSFETIVLYLKNLPHNMKRNQGLLRRIKENLELSPSYKENLAKGEWERRMRENVERIVNEQVLSTRHRS